MKPAQTAQPDVHSNQVLRVARRIVSFPLVLAVATCAGIAALYHRMRTKKENDTDDKLRQTRVRRKLRGLPADHVQEPRPTKSK